MAIYVHCPTGPRYNTKCSGVNKMQREIFRVVSRCSLYFVLYLGNSDYFWTVCVENALRKTIVLLLSKNICKTTHQL